jgi:hypothetical protein
MDARWTLERVQERISRGRIVDENVVDIEQNTLVKLGTHISADEGEAAQFVARSIGHPLPRIYATLHDEAVGAIYIVQEKLCGELLMIHLPTINTTYHPCQSRMRDEGRAPRTHQTNQAHAMGNFGQPTKYDHSVLYNSRCPTPLGNAQPAR